MAKELEVQAPNAIAIVGINEVGQEADNALMTTGRTLPWLQDEAGVNVWGAWQIRYRDVVILDAENRRVDVFNLTDHSLADATAYSDLKARLLDARSQ